MYAYSLKKQNNFIGLMWQQCWDPSHSLFKNFSFIAFIVFVAVVVVFRFVIIVVNSVFIVLLLVLYFSFFFYYTL